MVKIIMLALLYSLPILVQAQYTKLFETEREIYGLFLKSNKYQKYIHGISKLSEVNSDNVLTYRHISQKTDTIFASEILSFRYIQQFELLIPDVTELVLSLDSLQYLQFVEINCSITEFPEVLSRIPNLKTLDLEYNKISHIPSTIWESKKLEVLNISSQRTKSPTIVKVDSVLVENYSLKKLDISSNPLEIQDLSGLHGLEELNLSDCYLSEFPVGVVNLKHLKRLDLSGSYISEIPTSISELRALEYLDLSGNFFKMLPEDLYKLSNLVSLNLQNTQLASFPKSFYFLDLVYLDLRGTPLAENETLMVNLVASFRLKNPNIRVLWKEE